MPRSPESTAREAIRARSTRKLVGRRSDTEDGCVTGHPAFLDVRPAFELGRMPEGGGYPVGFVELAARLMECQDLGAVVHLCSGSVRSRFSFDIRPDTDCAVVADVRRLPIRNNSVRWIMVDPPYGADYAEELWGLGKVYPMPALILRECARILQPGGRVAMLHQVVPTLPDELERTGTYGVSTGTGYRIRALTIATKPADRSLFEGGDGPR